MKNLVSFLLFFCVSAAVQAQQGRGLKLLEIAPTPFELSVSEASVASPNGSSSIHSNPALLALDEASSIDLGYTNWVSDSNNLFGGLNLRKNNRAIAISFYTTGVTGFEQRNQPGDPEGEFSIEYLAISGAYAHDFKYFAVGGSFHYLNEEIYPYRASGYAFNVGLASRFLNNRIRVGTALSNKGKMEKLNSSPTKLPSNYSLGIAADVIEFTHNKNRDLPILLTVLADFVVPFDNETSTSSPDFNPEASFFNLGLAIRIAETVQLSAGYKTGDNTRPISFGAGFLANKFAFNYALIPFNTGYGTVHSIGIQYQL